MRLDLILEKNKHKAGDAIIGNKVFIAIEDRPYDLSTLSPPDSESLNDATKSNQITENNSHKVILDNSEPFENRQQTDNKLTTNQQQTDNKSATKNKKDNIKVPDFNSDKTNLVENLDTYFLTSSQPSFESSLNVTPEVSTEEYNTNNKVVTNRQQTDNKPTTNQKSDNNETLAAIVENKKSTKNQYLIQKPNNTDLNNKLQSSLQVNSTDVIGTKIITTEQKTNYKLTTNQEQTDNKPATNRQQTGNELATNQQQTDNKLETNENDKNNKLITNQQQTDNEPATKSITNQQQTGNKKTQYKQSKIDLFNISIHELIGLQKAVLILIYEDCKKARSNITKPIFLQEFANKLETSSGSIKTTLQRLEEKGFINRVSYKNGRGGWSKYELPDCFHKEIFEFEKENISSQVLSNFIDSKKEKPTTNWQQTSNQTDNKLATNLLSSSSLLTTTTEKFQKEEICLDYVENEEWKNIDLSFLEDFGFRYSHLEQIKKIGSLTPEQVQDSLRAFYFDLKENGLSNKLKTSPINYFMGIMRKKEVYVPPSNYEDEKTKKMKAYMLKKQEEIRKKQEIEQQILDMHYESWASSIDEEKVIEIIPEKRYREKGSIFRESCLKKYFMENEWLKIKKEIESL